MDKTMELLLEKTCHHKGNCNTIKISRLQKNRKEFLSNFINTLAPTDYKKPTRRSECTHERPCPFVSCRYNLFLDINRKSGNIILNFPGKEPCEMEESCALDLVEKKHSLTLDEIGNLLNITRERVRQIEEMAIKKLEKNKWKLEEYK